MHCKQGFALAEVTVAYLAVVWIHEYDVLHEGGRGCRHPSEGGREGAPPCNYRIILHQNYISDRKVT
jgi:hypothetical protein